MDKNMKCRVSFPTKYTVGSQWRLRRGNRAVVVEDRGTRVLLWVENWGAQPLVNKDTGKYSLTSYESDWDIVAEWKDPIMVNVTLYFNDIGKLIHVHDNTKHWEMPNMDRVYACVHIHKMIYKGEGI